LKIPPTRGKKTTAAVLIYVGILVYLCQWGGVTETRKISVSGSIPSLATIYFCSAGSEIVYNFLKLRHGSMGAWIGLPEG
jgi:hypothetical protein